MTHGDLRAVVVDDSHFMRTIVADMLERGGIDVVARVGDGAAAIDAVSAHSPDVVTMDVEMPGMNGLEATERIMNTTPTPICMLSAHTADGANVTFEALDRGAVDFFAKPGGEVSTTMSSLETQFVEKVITVAGSDPTALEGHESGSMRPTLDPGRAYAENATLLIAASTGGPSVVERVVSELPLDAALRVLVVQHMPNEFTERFAARLDAHSDYDVREASDGDRIGGGEALVARGGTHMEVARYASGRVRVRLTTDPPRHGVRPAADVTLESAARVITDPLCGVVLTGMGRDGATGAEAVARAGGYVIAQDEASCAVFGMPKQAIATGCVDQVVSAGDVSGAISAAMSREVAR